MKVKLQIDGRHTMLLLGGKPVTIKVPAGATNLELRLTEKCIPSTQRGDSMAKILDVFFNGRPA